MEEEKEKVDPVEILRNVLVAVAFGNIPVVMFFAAIHPAGMAVLVALIAILGVGAIYLDQRKGREL